MQSDNSFQITPSRSDRKSMQSSLADLEHGMAGCRAEGPGAEVLSQAKPSSLDGAAPMACPSTSPRPRLSPRSHGPRAPTSGRGGRYGRHPDRSGIFQTGLRFATNHLGHGPELAAALQTWLASRSGRLAEPVTAILAADRISDLVPLGVVAGLFNDEILLLRWRHNWRQSSWKEKGSEGKTASDLWSG
jgi:hypothetical protein